MISRRGKRLLFVIILLALLSLIIFFGYSIATIDVVAEKPFILVYHYVSSDLNFEDVEVPQKGRTLEMVESAFEKYILTNNLKNVKLMITSKPGEWDDTTHRRWNYEYLDRP